MKTYISDIIDNMGVSKFTWKIFILIGFVVLFDGYENMILAYSMPQIAKTFALTPVQSGLLVSWGLFGLALGAICAGTLSDTIGRKKTLIIASGVYSIFSGLIFFSTSFEMFALLRIVSGFGIGAATPVGASLIAEFVPSKNRGFFVSGSLAFFISGWIVAGVTAVLVIPAMGWRAVYLIGMLPALYIIVLGLKLPESARWLLIKGREKEAIKIIQGMEITATGTANDYAVGSLDVPPVPKVLGLRACYSGNYRKVTIKLWILNFMVVMIIYAISSWLPSLLVAQGLTVVKSYSFSIFQNIAAIIGCLSFGWVSDRTGRKRNGVIGFSALAVVVILLGFAANQWMLLFLIIVVGFVMNFAATSVQPLATESYPTEFRSTGLSWVQAFGRLGGVVGPLLVGYVQQIGFGFQATLGMFAAPAIICVILIVTFTETKGQRLEVLSKNEQAG